MRAGGARLERGQVARIVVVDVDRGRRQRLAEARHHVADRLLLVVAGDEDGDGEVFQAAVCIEVSGTSAAGCSRPARGALLFIEAVKARFRTLHGNSSPKWADMLDAERNDAGRHRGSASMPFWRSDAAVALARDAGRSSRSHAASGFPDASTPPATMTACCGSSQIRDLIAGQGWFDLHQYRMGPDGGFVMHWSRLVDAPIAAIMLAAAAVTGSMATGETVALVAWPLLLYAAGAVLPAADRPRRRRRARRCSRLCVIGGAALLLHRHLRAGRDRPSQRPARADAGHGAVPAACRARQSADFGAGSPASAPR